MGMGILVVANCYNDDVSVLKNDGDGTFAAQVRYEVGFRPASVAAADLDVDGDVDLLTANSMSADMSVLMNNGNGTFASQVRHGAGVVPDGVAAADVDGDGDVDAVVADASGNQAIVLRNQTISNRAPSRSSLPQPAFARTNRPARPLGTSHPPTPMRGIRSHTRWWRGRLERQRAVCDGGWATADGSGVRL